MITLSNEKQDLESLSRVLVFFKPDTCFRIILKNFFKSYTRVVNAVCTTLKFFLLCTLSDPTGQTS